MRHDYAEHGEPAQCFDDHIPGIAIQVRGGFIEQQQAWATEKRAGDQQPLSLPGRQLYAARAEQCIEAIAQCANAVQQAGLFDTRSMAYATDIPNFSEEQYGVPWTNPEAVERFNPAVHVKDWKTPMLVIHGARDYRVPLDQGIGAYTANQRVGAPTQYLHFPDENHWILKPRNIVAWYDNVLGFLAKHMH